MPRYLSTLLLMALALGVFILVVKAIMFFLHVH